jgi:GNAT superfamily N-acetyltransferase
MKPTIVIPTVPSPEDRAAILAGLVAFNRAEVGAANFQALSIVIRDPEANKTIGGLWGRTAFDWLFVELFFVPEHLRGQGFGSQILRQAESIALQRNCAESWLNTYSFQAPGFYLKQGYEIFGKLDDFPKGSSRFFFRKALS